MQHDESLLDREYEHTELIGLDVVTSAGETIGPVTDVLPGAANDNLIVRGTTGEILVPFIEDVILDISLASGTVTIEAIEGLLDLNEKKQK